MKQFSTPSSRVRDVGPPGINSIEWFLDGCWKKFKIIEDDITLPDGASLIGHTTFEDHLEELYQHGERFFRHAGGGRGFYWTQELQLTN